MSDDNIIQFPVRRAGPSAYEQTIIETAEQSGLDPDKLERLLKRLRPFLDTLSRPLNISVNVPVEFGESVQRDLECFVSVLESRDVDLLVERVKREVDLLNVV